MPSCLEDGKQERETTDIVNNECLRRVQKKKTEKGKLEERSDGEEAFYTM